jgi:hypothetical protein
MALEPTPVVKVLRFRAGQRSFHKSARRWSNPSPAPPRLLYGAMPTRLPRKKRWALVVGAWLAATIATVAVLVWVNQRLPRVYLGPHPEPRRPARTEWLVGRWNWESINPDVRYVETFTADGEWHLEVKGATIEGPKHAWWSTFSDDATTCMIFFDEKGPPDSGRIRTYQLEAPDTMREMDGNMLNLKRFTRLKETK